MSKSCPPFYVTCAATVVWALYYGGPYSPPIGIGTMVIFLGGAVALCIVAAIEAS